MRLKSIGRIVNFALRPAGLEIRKRHEVRPSTIPHNDPSLPASFFVECRVLANRLDLLDIIPKTGVVAEIGVADGDFSAEIIARTQPAILHLIDAWDLRASTASSTRIFHAALLLCIKGWPSRFCRRLPPSRLTACISTRPTLMSKPSQELHLCAGLVKDGGRIAGHDFCTGDPDPYSACPYGVIRAVYEFCLASGWAFEFITLDGNGHFSFCVKHH